MVYARNQPWKTQTQENVDAVAASNVANGVVRGPLRRGRGFWCEGIGQRGAQGNKGDGRHAIFEANQTSKNASKVSHDGSQKSNHSEGNEETRPSSTHASRWDQGENDL